MKLTILTLCLLTTGCSGWSPIQEVKASNGSTWYWIAPLPSSGGFASTGSGVNIYQGTINGRGYTVSSFR